MKYIIISSLLFFFVINLSRAEEEFASVFDGKNKPTVKKDGKWTTFTGKGMSVKTEGNWIPQEDGSLFLDPRPGEKGWTRYLSLIHI